VRTPHLLELALVRPGESLSCAASALRTCAGRPGGIPLRCAQPALCGNRAVRLRVRQTPCPISIPQPIVRTPPCAVMITQRHVRNPIANQLCGQRSVREPNPDRYGLCGKQTTTVLCGKRTRLISGQNNLGFFLTSGFRLRSASALFPHRVSTVPYRLITKPGFFTNPRPRNRYT